MKRFFSQPHTLFLFFALLFGLILVFLQPIGAGYDEDAHLSRIYEISVGHPMPNSYYAYGGFPESFLRVSYRQEKFLTPMDWTTFQNNLKETIHDPESVKYRTRATYSLVNYFPQAVIMYVFGNKLNFLLPILYYLLRLTYLLSFTLMGYVAIRVIPFGKWVLFILMLAPTTALQFSSITADAINFGVSFLFIAWSLHLVIDRVNINRKNTLITLLIVFLLASVKINSLPIFLLLIFIKPSQFSSRKSALMFWISTILLFATVAVLWNVISKQSLHIIGGSSAGIVANSLKTPLNFLSNLFTYISSTINSVISSWIAVYGYEYWTIPGIVYIFFPIALTLALIHDAGDKRMPLLLRLGLLGLFLILFIGTFVLRFIPGKVLGGPVSVQGRYFVVAMPFLFLGLIAWGHSLPLKKWLIPVSITLMVLCLGSYLGGMGLSYYRLCGQNIYNGRDCLLPVYKNWGPSTDKMVILPEKGVVQQSIVPDCNKIDRIKVELFDLDPTNMDETFHISLFDIKNEKIVAEQDFTMQTVADNGSIAMDFLPYENVVNREFLIQIKDISTSGKRLGIPVSDPGEYRGSFTINGESQNKDIQFHYRCVK